MTNQFEKCFRLLSKYVCKSDDDNWEDVVEDYLASHPDRTVYVVVYDGHLLYGDMLNNISGFTTTPEMAHIYVSRIILEIVSLTDTKITFSKFDDTWVQSQMKSLQEHAKMKKMVDEIRRLNLHFSS
jgi:hypothetical protein